MLHEHFREALETLDINLIRKIWHHAMPNLPQPRGDSEALTTIHIARTAASSISFAKRAYSHSWLIERNLPSQLPDHLRPKAERLYPITISAVGLATYTRTPAALLIRNAMEDAVRDAGVKNSSLTRRAILSARAKTRRLLGLD